MALHLLFLILFNLTHEMNAEALPEPNLTVDRAVMREIDSVTLNCTTEPIVSVSRCVFYIENKDMLPDSSCLKKLTGSELVKSANKKSPTELKVTCYYIIMIGSVDVKSSDSKPTIISINNLVPPTLAVNPLVISQSDSVALNCQPPSSVTVTDCYFYIGKQKTPQKHPCLNTVRGTDLLSLTKQSLLANIDVTCFYLKMHESAKSNLLTIIIQLPSPELRLNPQQITETDSVTVNCGTLSSFPMDKCFLYFIKSKTARSIFCMQNQTLTGRELVIMANQPLPAEVKLTCYYTVRTTAGGQHESPDSNMSSVTIIDVKPTTSQRVSAFSVTSDLNGTYSTIVSTISLTSGQTFGTTANTNSLSPSPAPVSTFSSTLDASKSTTVKMSTSQDSSTKLKKTFSVTPSVPKKTAEVKHFHPALYLTPPGIGVGVGVVLLIVGLLSSRWRSDKNTHRRSRVNFNDNFVAMNHLTNGGRLPVGDEDGYHKITSIPAVDSATESVQMSTPDSQEEKHEVYHVYSTIPDEPAECAIENKTYYTLQPH